MMTDKRRNFVKEFALTGNATQSAIKAGYSKKTAYQKGHQLRWQFQCEIEDETRHLMQAAVPGALAQIVDLTQLMGSVTEREKEEIPQTLN